MVCKNLTLTAIQLIMWVIQEVSRKYCFQTIQHYFSQYSRIIFLQKVKPASHNCNTFNYVGESRSIQKVLFSNYTTQFQSVQ